MNILFRVVVALQAFIAWLSIPFYLCKSKRPYSIPKIKNNILKYSATVLAEKIRNKELTSVEIIKAYIERIKEVNQYINAVVEDRFLDALNDAGKVDVFIAKSEISQDDLAIKYPLLGVPVTIKESCTVNGLSHCVGFKPRVGMKATEDGEAVRKLKESGAIPILVSTTPELCSGWEATTFVNGKTLCPYNRNYTAGGSSGGEGALLGCGASVIGIGSDVAGSIRIPAMFNGVFGHKPTPKIIPINGHYPMSPDKKVLDYCVIGPMTRYAEDLKLLTKVMAISGETLNLDEKVDLSRLKIYFLYEAEPRSILLAKTDTDIKTMIEKSVNHLRVNCNCLVNDYKFDMRETCELSATLLYKLEDIPNVLQNPTTGEVDKNPFLELTKSLFGFSDHTVISIFYYILEYTNVFVPKSKYDYFNEKAKALRLDFIEKLGDSGVFLYPTFPIPGLKHYQSIFKTASMLYVMIFNVLGLPATHVTLGKNRDGLPIGIQVVAAPNQDRLCFAVAEELERCFGGWTEP